MRLLVIACNVLSLCLTLYSVFVSASERPLSSGYKEAFPVDVTNATEHVLSKRDGTNGLNEKQRQEMLDRHNKLRAERKASDMLMLVWDTNIEMMAQAYADKCVYGHSTTPEREDKAGYKYLGENLFATTGEFDPATPVQIWYDEVSDYNYDTAACTKVCGHYTQVVWYNTKAVGCGVKYCSILQGSRIGSGHYVVCRYGPGGNVLWFKPYHLGEPCSKCPTEAPHCRNGLCSATADNPPGGNTSIQWSTSWTELMLMFVVHLFLL